MKVNNSNNTTESGCRISFVRNDFPALFQKVNNRELVYFDNAATTHKPSCVIEAISDFYSSDNSNVHRSGHTLSQRASEQFEAARNKVASFINASESEEIVFTGGTTESINLVAFSYGLKHLKSGDVILLTEMEHHSNLLPWQRIASLTGAAIKFIPVKDDGTLELTRLKDLLVPGVKILASTFISNTLGTVNDVRYLCAEARKVGAITLIDAAQASGHTKIDVQEIGCDFLAFSGHKMFGPTGIGVLYGRRNILEQTPPWQTGGGMITDVTYETAEWADIPYKFEAGTPNIEGAIGLAKAIDYINHVGLNTIEKHDLLLAMYAYDQLRRVPEVKVLGPTGERGALVSFIVSNVHAHDVVTFADQAGIALRGGHHCNQPLMKKLGVPAAVRASFAIYNTFSEIDYLVETVKDAVRFFAR
jgi:cysteine desulfurase/selenocysteine lyase